MRIHIHIRNLIMTILVMLYQVRHLIISGNKIQRMIIMGGEQVLQENNQ